MNTLQNYGSDSEDETVGASSSKVTPAAPIAESSNSTERRVDESASDEADQDSIDANAEDVFGLEGLAQNPPRVAASRPLSTSALDSTSAVRAAPEVFGDVSEASNMLLVRPTDTEMHVNIPYRDMVKSIQGPENPFSNRRLGTQQNSLSGHIESAAMNDFDFRSQHRTFETLGYARNPNQHGGSQFIGDQQRAVQLSGATSIEMRNNGASASYRRAAKEIRKKRKGAEGDPSIVEGEGAYVGPWAGWVGEGKEITGPSEEEIRRAEELSSSRQQEEAEMRGRRQEAEARGTEKSVFHGKNMYDYQGRTYMHVPTDVDVNLHSEPGEQESFLPRACVHTWTGHTKAISAMRLFPRSGHLILTSSMDTKIKLWDVYHEGNCLRTFMGHSKAVKDVTFSNDGRRFLSAGYDRQMKLWDTETGACLQAFSNGKMPNVIKFHPDEDKQHIFLAGMHDKKVVQFDINSGEITQEYDQHLGPVNTITFVDENRRFVTTSDDKTMRAWDFDIPVVIKYVADPLMHSMPAVTVHPNKKWLACQSLDNQILVYAADSFRQNRKKVFKGHNVSGYACQVGFSPDGRFISSGDGLGNLAMWDWKSGRLLKRLHGHKEAVVAHEWLPHETSKVVTASWDGTMKLWD